jgi:phosphatidylinositol alpha-mannosyltransferase
MPLHRPDSFTPLRIALVCPYSLSRPGGVQGQVVGLARALEGRGNKVTVFAPVDDIAHVPPGIDFVSTGSTVSLPANGSIAPVNVSPRAIRRARTIITSGAFDVVHVHEPFTPGLPYGLLLGAGVPPVVATFHRSGGSVFYTVLRPLTRRVSRRFAVQCAVSEAARDTASRAVRGTCEVTFNGVEIDRFQSVEPWPSDRPTVVFLGRHEERKGLVTLLEASARMEHRPRLWIAGDGPLTDTLSRHYPASEDVEWLGVLDEDEKVRRLRAAQVLCAPSLGGESFGMVLLEAMAARTVVVASDIAGYRAAAGGHAVLVPPADAAALASGLTGVLAGGSAVIAGPVGSRPDQSSDPRERWLDAAARRAGSFAIEHLAESYEDRYRWAMVNRPG